MASIDKDKAKPPRSPGRPGEMLEREYGHSSGDRNTRTDEHDWKYFKDRKEGTEGEEHTDDAAPSNDPRRRQ